MYVIFSTDSALLGIVFTFCASFIANSFFFFFFVVDSVNDRVGFGLMDAKKMVDLALNWTTVPPKVTCRVPRYGVNR